METYITREMGLSHAEFLRTLPRALEGSPYQRDGNNIVIREPRRQLIIQLAPEGKRQIALLQLPVTQVTFTFSGYTAADIDAFMQRFARYFQRGGG
jgi:hypothetical protein